MVKQIRVPNHSVKLLTSLNVTNTYRSQKTEVGFVFWLAQQGSNFSKNDLPPLFGAHRGTVLWLLQNSISKLHKRKHLKKIYEDSRDGKFYLQFLLFIGFQILGFHIANRLFLMRWMQRFLQFKPKPKCSLCVCSLIVGCTYTLQ